MMHTRFDQTDNKGGTLALEGDVTLEHADDMRSALIKALINADRVVLDFEKATKTDLSCLQLLCSAHRTSTRLNKRISFSGSFPEVLQRAADGAGYLRCRGCELDSQKSCLWTESCA